MDARGIGHGAGKPLMDRGSELADLDRRLRSTRKELDGLERLTREVMGEVSRMGGRLRELLDGFVQEARNLDEVRTELLAHATDRESLASPGPATTSAQGGIGSGLQGGAMAVTRSGTMGGGFDGLGSTSGVVDASSASTMHAAEAPAPTGQVRTRRRSPASGQALRVRIGWDRPSRRFSSTLSRAVPVRTGPSEANTASVLRSFVFTATPSGKRLERLGTGRPVTPTSGRGAPRRSIDGSTLAPLAAHPEGHAPRGFAQAVRDIARHGIRTAGRPLNRTEIMELLEGSGTPLPLHNTKQKVSKVLLDDRGLFNVRGKGYRIVGE